MQQAEVVPPFGSNLSCSDSNVEQDEALPSGLEAIISSVQQQMGDDNGCTHCVTTVSTQQQQGLIVKSIRQVEIYVLFNCSHIS